MTSASTGQSPAPMEAQPTEYEVLLVLDDSAEYRYAAFCPALPGCLSEGRTKDEAVAMIKDAAALYLTDLEPGEPLSAPVVSMETLADEYVAAGFPVETIKIGI